MDGHMITNRSIHVRQQQIDRRRLHGIPRRITVCGRWLIGFIALLLAGQGYSQPTRIKSDERVIFYPSAAKRAANTNEWQAEIRGCVFEPEKRGLTLALLRETLDLKDVEMTPAEEKIFNERARLFLVDHERGKKIFVRFGEKVFPAGKSAANGKFAGKVVLGNAELKRAFQAVLSSEDSRIFSGEVFPLEDEGVSVISDIDDTIKITEVRDKNATLRNTFLREFQPVPGMAEFYRTAATERNVSFHYISASPWQLYEPLVAFVRSNGFPAGTFELKEFRWKDKSFFSLFASPEKYKPGVIEPLLKQFPKRKFILVGDSGERDPEIYGALARKFPGQIFRILIRDVTSEPAESPRYQKAFRDVPTDKWQIFREPSEIKCLCE